MPESPVEAIPDVVTHPGPADYAEVMARAVFQAGLSWAAIAKRWNTYRQAFDGFDPARISAYTEGDVDRLMRTEGILHSARKHRAVIGNTQQILALHREYDGFAAYLASFDSYGALAHDLKMRFAFMGPMNVWYFLFRVHHPVPRFEGWVKTIAGKHPRMKEMVEKARKAGMSKEID